MEYAHEIKRQIRSGEHPLLFGGWWSISEALLPVVEPTNGLVQQLLSFPRLVYSNQGHVMYKLLGQGYVLGGRHFVVSVCGKSLLTGRPSALGFVLFKLPPVSYVLLPVYEQKREHH